MTSPYLELEKDELADLKSIKDLDAKEVKKAIKKDDSAIYTSFLETEDYILEQIIDAEDAELATLKRGEDRCAFIKYSKLNGEIDKVKEFEYKGKVYQPIVDDVLSKGGICLPNNVVEYKDTAEITKEIRQYLTERIQLPSKPINYEKFLPHLILFYWVYEKFPFVPYVHFVGGTATGKTTAMETFGSLCYKPVDSSSSLTIASMFRIATQWKGTLLIDEFEKAGESSKEIILFLKAGVSNRLLYRTEGEKKKVLVAYIIKSPKIFTSENPINDAGLQSRTMVIKMERNTKELPLYRLPEDYREAQEIRNKLLLWRLRNFNKIDLSSIKFGFPELKVFDRRVQQILTPIYYFTDNSARKDLLEFAKEHQDDTIRSRRDALDGLIFELMLDIWNEGKEVQVKQITSQVNEEQKGKGYKNEVTEKKVGNIIRKVIGFETERRGHDKSYWVIRNDEKITCKTDYYGIASTSLLDTASSANTANELEEAKQIFSI
jgi:hypothetical protein